MQALCNSLKCSIILQILLQPNPQKILNLPLYMHATKLYQTVKETGPNPFISFPPPAMKLQRKSLGAFCCLAAEMCNFWKCSSRIMRPRLSPPTRSSPNSVVPDSQSHKFLVRIKPKHLTQKCDYPPLLNTPSWGGKKKRSSKARK